MRIGITAVAPEVGKRITALANVTTGRNARNGLGEMDSSRYPGFDPVDNRYLSIYSDIETVQICVNDGSDHS